MLISKMRKIGSWTYAVAGGRNVGQIEKFLKIGLRALIE